MNRTLTKSLFILVLGTTASCASRHHNETSRPKISNAEDPAKAPPVVGEATVVLFDDEKIPQCTGTLVRGKVGKDGTPSGFYVFTARHCMVHTNDDNSVAPIFKAPALVLDTSTTVAWSGVLPLKATHLAFHAKRDIAVIKVEPYDATKAPGYKPIATAPVDLVLQAGQEGVIAGFGKTNDSFSSSAPSEPVLLRWGKMQYKQESEETIEFTSSTSSTCSGDSGGPVYTATNGGWVLAGVTSSSSWPCHKKFSAEFVDVRKFAQSAMSALSGDKADGWTVAPYPAAAP